MQQSTGKEIGLRTRREGGNGSGGSTTSTANRNTSPDYIRRKTLIKKAETIKNAATLLTVLFTCILVWWALPFTIFGLTLGHKVITCV